MRCHAAVYLVLILMCLAPGIALAEASLPDLIELVEPAVVFIKTFDNYGNQLNMGTGFFINPYGELITCRHVLKDACRASIETFNGQQFEVSQVTGLSSELDLVKLVIEHTSTPLPFLEITSDAPRKGERIVVIGHPRGYRFVVSEGIIAAFHRQPTGVSIQVTAPISPGSSGSPVINTRGKVIGVITCYNDTGQHLNFAVSAPMIHTLAISYPLTIEQLMKTSCDCLVMPPLIVP